MDDAITATTRSMEAVMSVEILVELFIVFVRLFAAGIAG